MPMSENLYVKDQKTVVGPVRCLALRGRWDARATETYLAKACNGVQWYATEDDDSCDLLREVGANLTFLSLRAAKRMSDASLSELTSLRFLDCLNRGKDALEFVRLRQLEQLAIDDRNDIRGLSSPSLTAVTLSSTRRPVSFFATAPNLRELKLQMVGKHPISLAAELPELRSLMVLKGSLSSFAGLNAPQLENITIDGAYASGPVDLRPLAHMPALRFVTIGIKNPAEFVGLDALSGRQEVRASVGEVGSR
ncbi:hypothetical protein [Blastococcus tunisiensis]|uniref:Leucine Rich repeat-containing protein n=1 Tax=Blastococcus tunisiensis TaxID=1798228 RepID=A0A1I2LH87_9ACTN|nr:hypothetical protein [Blastococcus sp. DSM 46838]SFF78654.1 hypothetical protein SAMN05216574_1273 [Blastococcus sp. DSM 46838]